MSIDATNDDDGGKDEVGGGGADGRAICGHTLVMVYKGQLIFTGRSAEAGLELTLSLSQSANAK